MAAVHTGTGLLALNSGIWKSKTNLDVVIARAVRKKFLIPVRSAGAVITHEFGHLVDKRIVGPLMGVGFSSAHTIYKPKDLNGLARRYGMYAASDANEGFAELFAAAHLIPKDKHDALLRKMERSMRSVRERLRRDKNASFSDLVPNASMFL
jgi:hypothetical protein